MRKDIFKEVRKEWGDYLEIGKDKIDKEKFEIEEEYGLLECYEEWKIEKERNWFPNSYKISVQLLKKYEIPSLSEDKLDNFLVKIDSYKYTGGGIFLSAIINELYEDGEIHLSSNNFYHLGCFNENKKIVVDGDCVNGIGSGMMSGEIIVKGNCGKYIGIEMKGGIIRVYSDNFNPKEQISENAEKGEIYHKEKLVWKDGEKK